MNKISTQPNKISFRPQVIIIRFCSYLAIYLIISKLLNKPAFPSIGKMFSFWWHEIAESKYSENVLTTLKNWLFVYPPTVVVAILCAHLLSTSRRVARIFEFDLNFWRSLPATCLFSFVSAAIGNGFFARSFPAIYITFFTIVYLITKAIIEIPDRRLEYLKRLNADHLFIAKCRFYEVLSPTIIAITQAASLSLLVLVSTEFLVGSNNGLGIGMRIIDLLNYTKYAEYWLYLLTIGVIGWLINAAMGFLQKRRSDEDGTSSL